MWLQLEKHSKENEISNIALVKSKNNLADGTRKRMAQSSLGN